MKKTAAKSAAKAATKAPAKKAAKAAKGAATKKAAAKGGKLKKGAKPAPGSKKDVAPPTQAQAISSLIESVNSRFGHRAISKASDYDSSYLLRRPTGITSLDIKLAGGIPASAPIVLTGPDGVGKDALLWQTAAETQRIYGDDFAMALYFTEFKADKLFMKDRCGLQIAFTNAELIEMDKARELNGMPPLTPTEIAHYKHEVGNIVICDGVTAEHGLDFVMDSVDTNAFQIVAVNSIGFLQTEAKEDTESLSEFAQQSNEAILLTKFAPRLALHLNRLDNYNRRNESSIILVNQVRGQRDQKRGMPGMPVQEKSKYQPGAGAHALRHGKAIEIMLHKGKAHYDEATKSAVGRVVDWEFTKGKLGTHDGVKGSYSYFYDTGFDLLGDLVTTAVELEVVSASGAWYSYTAADEAKSFQVQGIEKVRSFVAQNDLRDELRAACMTRAGIMYRWK